MSGLDQELLQDFLTEAHEQLELLDRGFANLEGDPTNYEFYEGVFLVLHTLKGGAGFMGLKVLERICYWGESLLHQMRQRKLQVTPTQLVLLVQSAGAIRTLLIEIAAGCPEPPFEHYLAQLARSYQPPMDDAWQLRTLQARLLVSPELNEMRNLP